MMSMFESGMIAGDLIALLKSEVDTAREIPDESYIGWLNDLEQLLYSEIIREYGVINRTITPAEAITLVAMNQLAVPADENPVRYEDIHAVYVNSSISNIYAGEGIELTKTTPASARVFNNVYFRLGTDLYCKSVTDISNLAIVYFARPKTKVLSAITATTVKIPIEFMDLARAKLRGEAYKLVNTDDIAAKWLADYNALLEIFKIWTAQRVPNFGV